MDGWKYVEILESDKRRGLDVSYSESCYVQVMLGHRPKYDDAQEMWNLAHKAGTGTKEEGGDISQLPGVTAQCEESCRRKRTLCRRNSSFEITDEDGGCDEGI